MGDSKYLAEVIKKFAPLNGLGIDPADNIKEIAEILLQNPDIICIQKENKGVILGIVYPLFYNTNILIAQELGWWVEPEYRGTTISIKLLKEFEQEAKKRGVSKIIMICLETQNPDGLKNIYERMDYKALEFSYVKES